jgi:Response regulator containing CheY-like receiver domain and AraC-type DNA-binding domain
MQFHKRLRDKTYFLRLLASFFLVLLIPMFFTSRIAFDSLFRQTEERLVEEVHRSFQNAVTNLNQQLIGLSHLATQTSSDSMFFPHNLGRNPYRTWQAMRQLGYYTSTNSFLESALFYHREKDVLFSAQTSFPSGKFASGNGGFSRFSDDAFKQLISSAKGFSMLGPLDAQYSDDKECVMFISQIPVSSSNPYGTLIVPVSQAALRTAVNVPIDSRQILLALDRNGSLIWNALASDEATTRNALAAYTKNPEIVSLDGERYLSMAVTSSFQGIQFIRLIPFDTLLSNARSEQIKWLTLFVLTFLIGLALIYFLSRINYHPFRQIFDMLQSTRHQPEHPAANELKTTKSILSALISQNEISQKAYEKNLVESLLRGGFATREEFNAQAAPIGFSLPYDTLQVVALSVENIARPAKPQEYIAMQSPAAENAVFYCLETLPGTLIMLLDGALPQEAVRMLVEDTCTRLETDTVCRLTAGIGKSVSKLPAVPTAYLQAITALDLRLLLGPQRIYFFSETIHEGPETDSRIELYLHRLRKQLMQGDREAIRAEIDALCGHIVASSASLFTVRLHFFTAFNAIISYAHKATLTSPLDVQQYDLFGVSAILSTQELIRMIHQLGDELCEKLAFEEASENNALIEDMLQYLESNALKPDFSLNAMASAFMMSDSNLSRYFKKKTGQNITNIVTAHRIGEAKKLLTETDLPIKEIVTRIGYFDISSFSKKFKLETGLSPGEYRSMGP